MEVFTEVATEVTAEITAEIAAEISTEVITEVLTELKARVKIRQPKELGVFNSPRLSIVLTAEILIKLVASGLGYHSQIWPIIPVV